MVNAIFSAEISLLKCSQNSNIFGSQPRPEPKLYPAKRILHIIQHAYSSVYAKLQTAKLIWSQKNRKAKKISW